MNIYQKDNKANFSRWDRFFWFRPQTCRLTAFILMIYMSSVIVCGIRINIKNKRGADCCAFIRLILTPSNKFGKFESEENRYNKRITNYFVTGIDQKVLINIRKIRLIYSNFLQFQVTESFNLLQFIFQSE